MTYYHYSTDPFAPTAQHQATKHVPFKVYAKVVPTHKDGKRIVYMRDLEKIANRVENDVEDTGLFTLAQPVASTVQIGRSPARVTIYGFLQLDRTDSPNESATTFPHLIHSGTDPGQPTSVVAGPTGGSTSWGQDVIAKIDHEVAWLKQALEAASPYLQHIFFIEYNGVKYGSEFRRKFRSFPLS
jgi:hypothetical protein